MTIKEVDMGKAGKRYRDTDTGKLTSKSAFEAQIQVPAVSNLIPAKSGIGPASPIASPISSLRDSLEHIAKSMTTLVELTRQSLKLQKGGDRDSMIGDADFIGPPKPPEPTGGGSGGGEFEMPEVGPKLGLALMLAGLAILFKFADKLIPVIAGVLKFAKSLYTNTLDFIDATKENLKGALTGPGVVVGALKLMGVDLVKTLKNSRFITSIKSGFGLLSSGKTVGLLRRFMNIFKPLISLGKTIVNLPIIKTIKSFFGKAGTFMRFLGKLFLPLTIIIGIWDFIKGALSGYKESDEETWAGKIVDAMGGGIKGLINGLITIPLDFLLDALAWVLKKFGWDDGAEALNSFSVTDFVNDIIDTVFDSIKGALKWVKTLFTNPVEALQKLWDALVGEGGLLDILYAPIDKVIGWVMGIFGFDEPDTALTDEDGNFIGLKQLAINSVRWVWEKIKSFFKFGADKLGIDLPSFPSIKDMIFNAVGGILPKPDKWYSRALYKAFPDLKTVAEAFQSGGKFEGGAFKAVGEETLEKGDKLYSADTGEETLETVEKATAKGDKLAEAQKESLALQGGPPGAVVIDQSVTKGGDTTSTTTSYQAEAAIDHSDKTAMLASLNQMIVN